MKKYFYYYRHFFRHMAWRMHSFIVFSFRGRHRFGNDQIIKPIMGNIFLRLILIFMMTIIVIFTAKDEKIEEEAAKWQARAITLLIIGTFSYVFHVWLGGLTPGDLYRGVPLHKCRTTVHQVSLFTTRFNSSTFKFKRQVTSKKKMWNNLLTAWPSLRHLENAEGVCENAGWETSQPVSGGLLKKRIFSSPDRHSRPRRIRQENRSHTQPPVQ